MGGLIIEAKPTVKYLRLTLDSEMSFFGQIKITVYNAGGSTLNQLMANFGSPTSSRKRLLMSVIQSVLIYDAEV